MAQQKSVTLVISHLLDPQHSQRYEEWLGKIMPIAAEFPGHLGANVIRPAAGQNLWSVIIRFDTLEHLYAWTQSETRRQLVAEIAPLLTEGDRTEVRTEPAFWFTPPAANVRQPRRWKQFLITLLVIFPAPTWCLRSLAHCYRRLKEACCCTSSMMPAWLRWWSGSGCPS